MPRLYSVPFEITLTAANTDYDICNIHPADDKPCKIACILIGQTSEVGDAQEEGVQFSLRRITGTVTDGTGGSTPTPEPIGHTQAFGGTVRVGDTAIATQSGGADTALDQMPWNVRATPWERYIPEELRHSATQGTRLILRMHTTVADDVSLKGTVYIEEA